MAEYVCSQCKNVRPCEITLNNRNSGHPQYCPLSADYYAQWERIDIPKQDKRSIPVKLPAEVGGY